MLTTGIQQNWNVLCDETELNEVDKKLLKGRQFLNPYSLET
ncbi:MAG: hypothetical protein RQ739_08195 [Desulfotignum sp.]|nr:hypothetical protein [Desulfotignum sp.]